MLLTKVKINDIIDIMEKNGLKKEIARITCSVSIGKYCIYHVFLYLKNKDRIVL